MKLVKSVESFDQKVGLEDFKKKFREARGHAQPLYAI